MSNNTISVNGGAMSNADCTVIMTRAWAIVRQTYCYSYIKFSRIGSHRFNACLRQAGAEAKSPVRSAVYWQSLKRIVSPVLPTPSQTRTLTIIGHLPAQTPAMRAEISQLSR
ncbi:MAG: hypothetical protein JWP25_8319 [Bradyrhizobium sp.]|nr:hypothetical protein [Bradyrhizobium sp.]